QVGRELELAVLDALQVTQQRHAIAGELMQVQRVAALRPRDVRLARELGARRRQLIGSSIIEAELFRPPVRILAAVAPWHAAGSAHSEVDLLAALIELFRDLRAGLGAADDQHGAGKELLGVAISI